MRVQVDSSGPDAVFGEMALVHGLPRTVTVRAKASSSLWLLHRTSFRTILREQAIAERKTRFAFLRQIEIFSTMSDRELSRVVAVVDEIETDADEPIIVEGEPADAMYILEDGQAVVSRSEESGEGEEFSKHRQAANGRHVLGGGEGLESPGAGTRAIKINGI